MLKKIRTVSKTKWKDLSTGGKVGKVVLRAAEIGLALTVGAYILLAIVTVVVTASIMMAVFTGLGEGMEQGINSTFDNHYHNRYW